VVMPRVLGFTLYAAAVGLVHDLHAWRGLESGPVQWTGAFLALLLVLRTNGGYERWWEARKLWGGIVNQSRNLAIAGLTYGPRDPAWRRRFAALVATFPHVCRESLRGSRELGPIEPLLPEELRGPLARVQHMPTFVSQRIAAMLREALQRGAMEPLAFHSAERERAMLIDHIGGCERILKTPLPRIHTIKLRRFILLYLLGLPVAVAGDAWWLPAIVTLFVSYALLAIDQIAAELENPFSKRNLSHLPLEDIAATVEGNVLALLNDGGARELPRAELWRPVREERLPDSERTH
ncbi:bestrophin family protein, partial [Aestuariivirga sp.]|uniref:bestrophin family protein n=1 Tax=Aestuariivirga sp. TaxID=2650926 RepID=UPI003918E85E